MGYLITLFLVLAAAFSWAVGGSSLDILGKAKSAIVNTVVPKSENEITVQNFRERYRTLDAFFESSAPALLKQPALPAKEKAALQEAVAAFQASKPLVEKIEEMIPKDTSIVRMMLNKALGGDTSPDPTSIPPQCRLECSQ